MTPPRRPSSRPVTSPAVPYDELAERRTRKQREREAREAYGSPPPPELLKPYVSPQEYTARASRRCDDDQSPA